MKPTKKIAKRTPYREVCKRLGVKPKPDKRFRNVVKEPTKFPAIQTGTHLNPDLLSLNYMAKHKPKMLKRIMKRSK